MNKFSLIKQLNSPEDSSPPPLPPGIQYQQYELEVDGKEQTINIPLREAENFEAAVAEVAVNITSPILKKLLREFRGIRG